MEMIEMTSYILQGVPSPRELGLGYSGLRSSQADGPLLQLSTAQAR